MARGVRRSGAAQVSGGDSCVGGGRQHRLGPVQDVHLVAALVAVLLQLGEGGGAVGVVVDVQDALLLQAKGKF